RWARPPPPNGCLHDPKCESFSGNLPLSANSNWRAAGGVVFNPLLTCLADQNPYTIQQAEDPRPTSSAFPHRRPTAEAKGGILPDQHGEPSFSRSLAAGEHGFPALETKEISSCRRTKISSASYERA